MTRHIPQKSVGTRFKSPVHHTCYQTENPVQTSSVQEGQEAWTEKGLGGNAKAEEGDIPGTATSLRQLHQQTARPGRRQTRSHQALLPLHQAPPPRIHRSQHPMSPGVGGSLRCGFIDHQRGELRGAGIQHISLASR